MSLANGRCDYCQEPLDPNPTSESMPPTHFQGANGIYDSIECKAMAENATPPITQFTAPTDPTVG